MKIVEKLITFFLIGGFSLASQAQGLISNDENEADSKHSNSFSPTRYSSRLEQVDRGELIYLLNIADSDEDEVEILEARIEAIKQRLEGTNPECRGM